MTSDYTVNESDLREALDPEFYSDIIECGGLARAIEGAAHEYSVNLGAVRPQSKMRLALYRTASVKSNRGRVRIGIILGNRTFSMAFDSARGHFVWASGGTGNLVDVVQALDAWRNGCLLADMNRRFPFIQYPRLSLGYENGTPVETAWEILFEGASDSGRNELLATVYADERLRKLFPYFSHETLRLARNCYDREAGEFSVAWQPDATILVNFSSAHHDMRRTVRAPMEIADAILSMLDDSASDAS